MPRRPPPLTCRDLRQMWERSPLELSPATVEILKRVCPPVEDAPVAPPQEQS